MPVEIAVGPPLLSANYGSTFMVTDLARDTQPDTEQGVFADDTRHHNRPGLGPTGR